MIRTCSRGHHVSEDYLKACPKCGGQLPPVPVDEDDAETGETTPTEDQPGFLNRAPRGLPMVVAGVVLALFGSLLSYAADKGPAEFFGRVLLGLGSVLLLIGSVALGVKLGIEDADKDRAGTRLG